MKKKFDFSLIIITVLMIISCDTGVIPQNTNLNENEKVSNPIFSLDSGTYDEDITIELSSETKYANIYYTIDGTEPTTESFLYSSPINIVDDETTQTIKAFATRSGYENSDVISKSYEIDYKKIESPTFSILPGTYDTNQEVEISCETAGVVIYYTIDGSDPNTDSNVYTDSILLNEDEISVTISAFGVKSGMKDSDIISGNFIIDYGYVQTPVFNIAPGTYSEDISVKISCATSYSIIYYTVDGSNPNNLSYEYISPILISGDMTTTEIRAYAVKEGKDDSLINSGVYTIEYILEAPDNLNASIINFDSVTLNWDSVELAEEYVLYKFYSPTPMTPTMFNDFLALHKNLKQDSGLGNFPIQ